MGQGVRRFTDFRAWQTSYAYKKAIYDLCAAPPLAVDKRLRDQLEAAVAGPPAHIAEGYGRFNPADFARFTVMARASLMESQNHLLDAVDRGHITEATRLQLNAMAEVALQEVTGLLEYLQSPEALRNARRARERRIASRPERRGTSNPEPGTQKRRPPTSETLEPGTPNRELGTPNREPGTPNREPGTPNRELRSSNPNLNTNRAPRTRKSER